MSYLNLINNVTLFRSLYAIDLELAEKCRNGRCQHDGCYGPLHEAYYSRKPRGVNLKIPDEYSIRMSLCCGWCRKRTLPKSCLFFGRKVYWGVVIILVTAAIQGTKKHNITELCIRFGMSRRTIGRWVSYFELSFSKTKQWLNLRGRLSADVWDNLLPLTLVKQFLLDEEKIHPMDALCRLMRFLASGC
jgi:hypothetical protein